MVHWHSDILDLTLPHVIKILLRMGIFLHFNTLVLPIFDKSVFISSGWGLTEHGKKYPKVLRSVNLKVSAEEPTGFLRTLGREKEYGVCKVT